MIHLHQIAFPRRLGAIALLSSLALGGMIPAARQARAADAGPNAGNTLSIAWATETKSLDPGGNAQNPDIWVSVNIYDPLIRIANDGNTLVPALATSWDISKDALSYTFHLRHNVKFHNGATLTSEDVKFSLLRTAEPKRNWSFLFTAIKSIDAPDANTVIIHVKHPWGPFLADMTVFASGIIPEAYLNKVGASYLASHPIGTGPYMFDTWVKGQYLRLKKNPNYWDAAKYPMQYLEYQLIPSDNTRLLKVQAGELDVDNVLPYNQIAALKSSQTAVALINKSTQTNYLTFNTKVKPFDDVNVRQALNHAIDRAAIAKAVTYGYGTPANSFMPAGALFYDPNIPVPATSLALAKQYLAKSSVPHGFSMTMETSAGDSVGNEIAQIFQQEIAALGIKVTIKQIDPTTLFTDQQNGKYNFTPNLWTNDIPDPDELVSFGLDYLHGGASAFYTWYNNPQTIKLSQAGEQSNDLGARKNLYYQIQQIWAHDVPFLALYYTPFINAVSTKVHGFSENPLGYFNLQGVTKS